MLLPMSLVKGFGTRFAGFLKSPGHGLYLRGELGKELACCHTPAHWWVCSGLQPECTGPDLYWALGPAPMGTLPAEPHTDGMPGQPGQPSHPRVEQCQAVGAPHSPLQVPLLHCGTPLCWCLRGFHVSGAERALNKPQSSKGLCCHTYCPWHSSNRSP